MGQGLPDGRLPNHPAGLAHGLCFWPRRAWLLTKLGASMRPKWRAPVEITAQKNPKRNSGIVGSLASPLSGRRRSRHPNRSSFLVNSRLRPGAIFSVLPGTPKNQVFFRKLHPNFSKPVKVSLVCTGSAKTRPAKVEKHLSVQNGAPVKN